MDLHGSSWIVIDHMENPLKNLWKHLEAEAGGLASNVGQATAVSSGVRGRTRLMRQYRHLDGPA
jgi:hypothetical protein